MQRLGITDGKQFLKRRLKEEESSLVFLQTCCVGKNIQDHIEAAIDEAITTGGWVHTKVSLRAFCFCQIKVFVSLILLLRD